MDKLLIVHIDGFSYEYISPKQTPFLNELALSGIVRRMTPSPFFQANISAYTGKEALYHGRLVEYIYDPEHSPLRGLRGFSHWLDVFDNLLPPFIDKLWRYGFSWLYSTLANQPPIKLHFIPFRLSPYFSFAFNEPYIGQIDIFSLARRSGLRTAWDDVDFSSNVKRRWLGTSFYKFYPDAMLNWAAGKIRDGVELIWVDLGAELDRYGHRYGPAPSRFLRAVRMMDKNLQSLITIARKNKYNFIAFSDHGMEEVKELLNISALLDNAGLGIEKDYIPFYDSTVARFWTEKSEIALRLKALLSNIKGGILIEGANKIDYGIPLDYSIGELLLAVEQGWLLLPNFYQGKIKVKGMHGYLGRSSGALDGFFASDVAGELPQPLEVSDIAKLALEAVGLKWV